MSAHVRKSDQTFHIPLQRGGGCLSPDNQRRILSIKWNDFIPNVTMAAASRGQHRQIICACRLGLFGYVARLSRDVPASNVHPHYLLCIWRWKYPTLPAGAELEDLESSDLITSLPIPASDPILTGTRFCTGGQSLRPQRLRVTGGAVRPSILIVASITATS